MWDRIGHASRIRSLLQWIGVWPGISGASMAIASLIGVFVWGHFEALSGPIRYVLALAALMLVGGVFVFTRYLFGANLAAEASPTGLLDAHGLPYQTSNARDRRRWIARIVSSAIVLVAFATAYYAGGFEKLALALKPETAIFMACSQWPFPIKAQPNHVGYVTLVTRNRVKASGIGFFRIYSDWPDKHLLQQVAKSKNVVSASGYACKVSNHGPTALLSLVVNLFVWFGPDGGEKNKLTYPVIIAPLDKEFEFYVVNPCNSTVHVVWSDNASAHVFGERDEREIPLRTMGTSALGQIMDFPATSINWSSDPCS